MNRPDNLFTSEIIKRISGYLDIVAKSTGPACLVTIGTGAKVFSTGFDLKFWQQDSMNILQSPP